MLSVEKRTIANVTCLFASRVPVVLTIIFIADFLFRLSLYWHNRKHFLTRFSAIIDYMAVVTLFLQLPMVVTSTSLIVQGKYYHEVTPEMLLLSEQK